MNNHSQVYGNENNAQDYYPKALSLGQNENEQKKEPQYPQQSPQNSPFSALFSNLFSGGNQASSFPQITQLFGGNPLLSALLTGNMNQSDMMSKLMSSFSQKSELKEEKERVIDLSNSIEEL